MLLKPGKSSEDVTSYRPIQTWKLHSSLSKPLEKLLLERLKPIIKEKHLIPEHQFGFRNNHSTIDQVHCVTNEIFKTLKGKEYRCEVFIDVVQVFGKVWHKGFLTKPWEQLPQTWCAFIESYLNDRGFRVIHEEVVTEWNDMLEYQNVVF